MGILNSDYLEILHVSYHWTKWSGSSGVLDMPYNITSWRLEVGATFYLKTRD